MIASKIRRFAGKNKKALAIGGAIAGAGALAYGISRLRRGGSVAPKRNSLARARSRVERLTLKIKEKQLKRKLFKESLRF